MEQARAAMKFAPSGLQQMVRAPHAGPLRKVLRYTAPFMSYAANPFTAARATAFQGMGMMPPALTRANGEQRALGARMITTITTAAT